MTCRNNKNGFHIPGPASAYGRVFCIHCGEQLTHNNSSGKEKEPDITFAAVVGTVFITIILMGLTAVFYLLVLRTALQQ